MTNVKWYRGGKGKLQEVLEGLNQNPYIFSHQIFRLESTPQGRGHWMEVYRHVLQRFRGLNGYWDRGGYICPGLYDGILSDEDKAFFKVILRDKRKSSDKFLTVKANKEYVEYADGLITEEKTNSK